MIDIAAWTLAAIFLAVVCVLVWFFLKLFFRLALVVIAISFFIAFLYHYSLLPESWAKQVEAVILRTQEIMKTQFEKKLHSHKTKAVQKSANFTQQESCDVIFC